MATKALSREKLALGRAVLLVTDTLGMSVEGAFWIYDDEENAWDYFLVTSLYNRVGARKIYKRLNKALREMLSEEEARKFVLFIADPNEKLAQAVRKAVQTTPLASQPLSADVKFNGHKTSAKIYRMADGMSEQGIKSTQRRFVRRFKQLGTA